MQEGENRESKIEKHRASKFDLLSIFTLRFSAHLAFGSALALVFLLTGCLHRPKQASRLPAPGAPSPLPSPGGPAPAPAPSAAPIQQGEEGIASWYGHPYHGRPTASGEIYNMYAISAAHRTLPFGTEVRVHNLDNGLSLVVRVNDRGPFIEGRIIDLSYAAARAIHMEGAGTARVRLEILGFAPGTLQPGIFAVQVGAFRDLSNAERLMERIASRFSPVVIQSFDRGDGLFHRVRVGRESSEEAARALAINLRASNIATETFVVRLN